MKQFFKTWNYVKNDTLIINTFSRYFCNIVKNLSIPKDPSFEDRDKFM